MKTSESIANIASALVQFQAEVSNPEKKGINPHFKSKYAELDDIITTIRPTLEKHGLAFIQNPVQSDGQVGVYTVLIHKSGEFIQFDPVMIPLQKATPHQVGSALTYAKRYSLSSALGIATEEDQDANDISPQPQRIKQHYQKTQDKFVQATETPEQKKTKAFKAIFAESRNKGLSDDQFKAIVKAETGKESRKDLTIEEIKALYKLLKNHTSDELKETAKAHLAQQAASVA